MDKFTGKFWKWMENKGYAKSECNEHTRNKRIYWQTGHDDWYPEFTNQMLIGYMIEYLVEHKKLIFGSWDDFFKFTILTVDGLYDILTQKIKEV